MHTVGYQIDTVTGNGEVTNYEFDENGRLTLIQRDGVTIDLSHDADDRLTTVENETTGTTTQYVYDGQGNRVGVVEGSEVRQILVSPVMGSGLSSTDLIADGSGNLISNYVYAGGASPFMMLDSNGNPVYYLTDSMGSVIGLADGSGTEVGDFRYDSFGNVRDEWGGANDSTGGDFRFQGQWLESETGLYHFRARDYDARTGTFLSRDPVAPTQQQAEALNPYQFAYNNPHVYSDPTGMFTLTEINASIETQNIMNTIQAQLTNQARQYVIDQARGVVGNLIQTALSPLMPDMWMTNVMDKYLPDSQGTMLDAFVRDQVCAFFRGWDGSASLTERLWFNPEIDEGGEPHSNGFNCSDPNGEFFDNFNPEYPNPDFLFKRKGPDSHDKNPKGWLVGDIKLNTRRLHTDK